MAVRCGIFFSGTVELRRSLLVYYLGVLALFGAPVVLGHIGALDDTMLMLSILAGGAVMLYGWLNRFLLVIHYSGGKISFRGGGSARRAMIELRKALLETLAKHE